MGAVGAKPALGGADPGLALLQSATLWLDASDVTAGSQWIRNKGTGGRALDARFGSVGQAQIIKGALKLPGSAGNFASTPDAAPLDITGDIEMIVRVTIGSTSGIQALISKWAGAAANGSYYWRLESSSIAFYYTADGSNAGATRSYVVAHGQSVGQTVWLRVTRVQSTGVIEFLWAADQPTIPSSWTSLGSEVNSTEAMFSGNAQLRVGMDADGNNPLSGSVFRAIVRSGIGGTTVFDADFTGVADLATSFTESSANAATVTINSTSGVDTNDPLLLPHTGTNYLYLPGLSGNRALANEIAAYDITGSLEIITRIRLESASANGEIIGKWFGGGNNWSYTVRQNAANIEFYISTTGSDFHSVIAAHGQSVGTFFWLRATRDGSTGAMTLFTAADSTSIPSSWSQIGTQTRTTTPIWNSNAGLTIGADGGGLLPWNGSILRAIVRNGIGGTTVFDADFTANTNQTSFTESSSNAATVTIERAATGRKSVMVVRPTLLVGTDDFLELSSASFLDFGATDDFTLMFVARRWSNGPSYKFVFRKFSGSTDGYALMYDNSIANYSLILHDAVDADSVGRPTPTTTLGAIETVTATVNRTVGNVAQGFVGTTGGATSSLAAIGSLTSTSALRISHDSDQEIFHAMVWPQRVLTSAEIGQIMTTLGV